MPIGARALRSHRVIANDVVHEDHVPSRALNGVAEHCGADALVLLVGNCVFPPIDTVAFGFAFAFAAGWTKGSLSFCPSFLLSLFSRHSDTSFRGVRFSLFLFEDLLLDRS